MSDVRKINEKPKELEKEIYIISVSDITSKKNPKRKRYLIETNEDSYKFDEDIVVQYMLFKGKQFTKKEFKEVLQQALINEAFNKALNPLSRAKKSTYEIREYLRGNNTKTQNHYSEDIIDEAIKKLHEFHFLNDLEYAKSVLETYSETKGPKWIQHKLEEKRIHQDIIRQVMPLYQGDFNGALKIANRMLENEDFSHYPITKQKNKIMNKLVSNGYTLETASKIIKDLEFVDESDSELEKETQKIYQRLLKKIDSGELTKYEAKQKLVNSLLTKGYQYKKINEEINKLEK